MRARVRGWRVGELLVIIANMNIISENVIPTARELKSTFVSFIFAVINAPMNVPTTAPAKTTMFAIFCEIIL